MLIIYLIRSMSAVNLLKIGQKHKTSQLLSIRSKGHGSGFTMTLSGIHRYLYRMHCLIPPPSLAQRQYTKPAQINCGTDSTTVPASKIKGNCAGNTSKTLIIATRTRSVQYIAAVYVVMYMNVPGYLTSSLESIKIDGLRMDCLILLLSLMDQGHS